MTSLVMTLTFVDVDSNQALPTIDATNLPARQKIAPLMIRASLIT